MRRFTRFLLVILVSSGTAIFGHFSAAADDGSDLAVHLTGTGFFLLPYGRFDVSVTNNGPEPLQSATVTLRADRPITSTQTPCATDRPSATVTCQFGPLAVGATATASSVIVIGLNITSQHPDSVRLTAARATSAPADQNSANDSHIVRCDWIPQPNPNNGFPSGRLWCYDAPGQLR